MGEIQARSIINRIKPVVIQRPVPRALRPLGGQGQPGPPGQATDSHVPSPVGQPDGVTLVVQDDALAYAPPAYDDMLSLTLLYENRRT